MPAAAPFTYDFRRSDWSAKPAKYVNALNWGAVTHSIVHWPGSIGVSIGTDKATIASYLRGWQTYHMTTKGWSDIAYSVAVDLAGRIWELRGWDRREGGTSGWGGRSVSILLIMGSKDKMTDAMKAGVIRCQQYAKARGGGDVIARWHSWAVQTDCPGPEATAWGKAGFPAPTPTPPTPERVYHLGDRLLSKSGADSGTDVVELIDALNTLGYKLVQDGSFGPAVDGAVRDFQAKHGLTASSDAPPRSTPELVW